MTLQERTLYFRRVQYNGLKMMLLQGQWKAKYSGCVRGMGLGPLPVRPTSQSFASSASLLNHEAAFNT
jgi:hypothetical protein